MRGLRLVWAALIGWWVDMVLTLLVVGTLDAIADITTQTLTLSDPLHVFIRVIIPIFMTMVGGGVAGRLMSTDAAAAGALVGGIGLLLMLDTGVDHADPYALVWIVAQCVAVVAAAGTALLVARRYTQKKDEQ